MKRLVLSSLLILLGSVAILAQATGTVFYQEVTWAPDGKHLSYTVYRKTDPDSKQVISEIYVMKPDGSDRKKIADEARWTSWTPDGKRILFSRTSADNKTADLFLIKLDGSGLVQLTKDTKRSGQAALSPDGKRIVFASTRDSTKNQIYVMRSDGTGAKRLTSDDAIGYFNPMWSPNGWQIVFYAEKGDQKDQVWTMNSDGSNPTLLTNNIGHNTYPAFSADGKSVIFHSSRDNTDGIFTMDAKNGSGLRRVTDLKGFFARISPNGKRVALIAGGFPSNDVYIANADFTDPVKITP